VNDTQITLVVHSGTFANLFPAEIISDSFLRVGNSLDSRVASRPGSPSDSHHRGYAEASCERLGDLVAVYSPSTGAAFHCRKYSPYMAAHPINGTASPAFSVPK
jgi:hypothetical protein